MREEKYPPLSSEADEAFGKALENVVSSILERSDAERRETQPWKNLFKASEGGLEGIIYEADHQLMAIVLSTAETISQKFGVRCSNKLFNLVKALPFALNQVEDEIQNSQGFSCCADKARRVYGEEIMAEIHRLKKENDNPNFETTS